MMAWLRRWFARRTPPPVDFYQRLHEAQVNAHAQTQASLRATQRMRHEPTGNVIRDAYLGLSKEARRER